MTCATGSQSQMVVEDSATPTFPNTAASLKYEFLSETLSGSQQQIDVAGMSGSRERRAQTLVDGPQEVSGDIVMYVTPIDLDTWLPRILGAAEVADVFDIAETLPVFGVLIDRVALKSTLATFAYKGCVVSRCVIAGSSGNPVTMTVTILGKTETFEGEAFPASPALPTGSNAQPYVFHEGVLTYNSQTYQYNSFELIIDNFAEARLENALTAEEICTTDLAVNLNVNVPWLDAFASDYEAADVTGNLTFTKGGLSTIFTFGELVQTTQAPNVSGKGQIRWNLPLEARLSADGTTPAISVTNDSVA